MSQLSAYWPAIIGYLVLINIAAFAAMALDKRSAQKQTWRMPESSLFMLALLGGSIGAIIGLYHFRHKTKHILFTFGMPLILLLQIATSVYLFLV
jgi:uncharacterized membrane protein YsdA (DUF1294 family)